MRWKILRDSNMAVMMTEMPSSVSTMAAAARAASVAPCTAMPMSARFSAGASLTPSPVMPVMWPMPWMRFTIRNLCSGMTSAKPCASMMTLSTAAASASPASSSSVLRMLVPMPSSRHVSRAILPWSPVTILTSTPFSIASRIVAAESGRGGSKSESTPRYSQRSSPSPSEAATPSERKPRAASSSTTAPTRAAICALFQAMRRMTCGAPLDTLKREPSARWQMEIVRLATGSKGVWSSSAVAASSAARAGDRLLTMHVSIASRSPPRCEAAAAWKSRSSASGECSSTGSRRLSLLSVNVPVLSEQSTVMPASSSMADRRATITFFSAMMWLPTAIVEVTTTSIATGMEATRMTTTEPSVETPRLTPGIGLIELAALSQT